MFRFIIKFLKVLAIACIIGVGLRVIDVVFYRQKTNETDKEIEETISENVIVDSNEESVSQSIENVVIMEEQSEITQEEKIEIKENKEAETVIIKSNETIKEETTQEQTITKQEQIEQKQTVSQVVENKQEEQTQQEEIKKEDVKVEEQVKEEKQEETKVEQEKEQQEQIITEEYKINEKMIDRIKTIIENNETEDMKTYGYEIVPDSTIPELTNEFTFTEQRVINKITWKSGIIRIYARDYYFNGNYISTQCFII